MAGPASQVSSEDEASPEVVDVEVQASIGPSQEHEAKVSRFTELLLHGPTGHRDPARGGLVPPLTAWPLPADLADIDHMLANALGGPLPPPAESPRDSTEESVVDDSASSFMEDMSLGEVPQGAPGYGRLGRASPGELSPSPLSQGEIASDAASLGELPARDRADMSHPGSESGEVYGRSFGEVSSLTEGPSSGEVSSFDVAAWTSPAGGLELSGTAQPSPAGGHWHGGGGRDWAAEHLEPGEVLPIGSGPGSVAELSEGEAGADFESEYRLSPSSGEIPILAGMDRDLDSPGAMSISRSLSSRDVEPYLSPPL